MELEFATTACVRPELLEKTYKSLNQVLKDVDTREEGKLYINIDPVPVSDQDMIEKELDIANEYFDEVVYNIGEEGGNFLKAVDWIFSQPEGEYFFHCEDDWRLHGGEIIIENYIERIENDPRGRVLQCITENNGGGNRVHFPPNLMNNKILQDILNKHPFPIGKDLNVRKDPEQWIKLIKLEGKVDYNVVCDSNISRTDLGRDWARSRGIKKSLLGDNPAAFNKWDLSDFSGD